MTWNMEQTIGKDKVKWNMGQNIGQDIQSNMEYEAKYWTASRKMGQNMDRTK